MSQWGQPQQGFQYPMQTGYPAGNPQFQQNAQFQPQGPQFQQQTPQFQPQGPQFQQSGFGGPNSGGLLPQQTGFPIQRPQGFQQPQQTGFPGGQGFVQSQPTGFGGGNFGQQSRPPPPPVPPLPTQFQQQNQSSGFLNLPPNQQQNNRFLSPSPALGGPGLATQQTGFPIRAAPVLPQMTGYVDPRLQMMSQTFMPLNTSSPYAGGVPQLAPQQNLQLSIQQHNQQQRGTEHQQMSWALTKAEKKNYDNIFRSWDSQGTGFINGQTAIEVFGASGLPKDDLARIWMLADRDNRGKLNMAEFHVAMGLIYRRLNGMPLPDALPAELEPPSSRGLGDSVTFVKELLDSEARSRSPSSIDKPISLTKVRTWGGSSPSVESGRDATIYKHSDYEPPGGFYKPRSRHVDRDAIRRTDDDSPSSDLSDMKRQLANTAHRLDRAAEAEASRTKEDEELDQEMADLKYRVKRVQEDLDYNSRGPRSSAKEEEKRKLEREMLSLMHERIPEVERKVKARDERKEREKREWTRNRDRANDRFGRYDRTEDSYSSRRYDDDRDRPSSRNYDRDSRSSYRRSPSRSRSRSRERRSPRDRDYDHSRSSPSLRSVPSPAPPSLSRDAPAAPPVHAPAPPRPTPSPAPPKNMSAAERQAYARAEAQRRIQARMAALGVSTPSTPAIDTTVEDRLQQEKKEAEEKAKAAEREREERERSRKERLDGDRALKEGRTTPAVPTTPTKTIPTTTLPPAPAPKVAPPPPKPRAPAPPISRKAPAPKAFSANVPPPKLVAPVASATPLLPKEPEVDPEEERLRAREEAIKKQREERAARLRQLEKEEEEAARLEEERYQARAQALKTKAKKPPTPPPAPAVPTAPRFSPPVARTSTAPSFSAPASALSPVEKSTNPFSRLIKEGGVSGTTNTASAPSTPPVTTATNGSTNPWARPQTAPPPSVPPPSKSPVPSAVKTSYQTAPSAVEDDWDEIKENDEDDDSSDDDEITRSRAARANIAQALFGNILPRPTSAAASSPSSPAPIGAPPPPPPPPPAPAPPPFASAPAFVPVAPPAASDVGALLQSIQGGARLRPTKTVDKSGPQLSGKVLGDTAPPTHINAVPRPVSPPRAASPPAPREVYTSRTPLVPETAPMSNDIDSKSSNRQSVDWFASRAADAGTAPVERLPSTLEDEEEEPEETYGTPPSVPAIQVDEPVPDSITDLMSDIDKSIEHRVRSLYAYDGDGEDLSFNENVILVANPSKSGGDWWYGKTVNGGKSGLFPKTYVETFRPVKAKALYAYAPGGSDELPLNEGDEISIIDRSDEEWWKAEQNGVVFIVPAAYMEVVEVGRRSSASSPSFTMTTSPQTPQIAFSAPQNPTSASSGRNIQEFEPIQEKVQLDDDSDSDYLSFDESDNEEKPDTNEDRIARERERQLVLEAAGLIVKTDEEVKPPSKLVRARSKSSRRPAPAAPRPRLVLAESMKDLPPLPLPEATGENEAERMQELDEEEQEQEKEKEEVIDHAAQLDDAFARYESFKNTQLNMNRLSVVSTDSNFTTPSSPTSITTISAPSIISTSHSHSSAASGGASVPFGGGGGAGAARDRDNEHRYTNFLHFLTRSKTPEGEKERRSVGMLNISAPMMLNSGGTSGSASGAGSASGTLTSTTPTLESPSRAPSPSFGTSWASLVDKTALDGIPPEERRRQEAIFELINTEMAYVRDLQLIVEVFYSSMLPLLSEKEITVVFANIEDILLTNTVFVSSLEERQKDCRLYIDKIGDILLNHMPNMVVYMEYCVNQSTAIKVLQSLRETKPELAAHLTRLRDDPAVRSLDLSSYLLAPMQRITRYPLLIKQILHYTTDSGQEQAAISQTKDISEKLLASINETIRDQEGRETLKRISQFLWIGQGRLDLTAPTRYMGARKLLKTGIVLKAKSGRRLQAFLCSDILVLTDEGLKPTLYRMPIPLAHAQVKEVPGGLRDEHAFQVTQAYPRGGDSIALKASSAKECQQWVYAIESTSRRCRHAEEKTVRKGASGKR